MIRALVALIALALALPVAAIAQAPESNAPPGNSAVDEYLETIPGASGNKRPRQPGQSSGGSALTAAQRARLERLGPDGEALANAVDATSSGKQKGSTTHKLEPESDGRSPASAVLDTFAGSGGGGGMGVALPAILIAALLAAILFVLLRRRAAS